MDSKMIVICAFIVAGLAVCAIATFNAINDNGHDEKPSGPTLEDAVLKLADEMRANLVRNVADKTIYWPDTVWDHDYGAGDPAGRPQWVKSDGTYIEWAYKSNNSTSIYKIKAQNITSVSYQNGRYIEWIDPWTHEREYPI